MDMSNDLVDGIGESHRALEFRSSIQQEQSKLDQEVIRLINQRQQLERSLFTLKDLEKSCISGREQSAINNSFNEYIRQRANLDDRRASQVF